MSPLKEFAEPKSIAGTSLLLRLDSRHRALPRDVGVEQWLAEFASAAYRLRMESMTCASVFRKEKQRSA
jgi:hypothetical protein